MPDRYRITLKPSGLVFGILDRETYDWCGLPDEDGKILPLEWAVKHGAEAWLNMCYRTWNRWELAGGGIPPRHWKPRPPELPPWDRPQQRTDVNK